MIGTAVPTKVRAVPRRRLQGVEFEGLRLCCNIKSIAKGYSRAFQSFLDCTPHALGYPRAVQRFVLWTFPPSIHLKPRTCRGFLCSQSCRRPTDLSWAESAVAAGRWRPFFPRLR